MLMFSSLAFCHISKLLTLRTQGWRQGKASGAIFPPPEHASPPSEDEKRFFGDFSHS